MKSPSEPDWLTGAKAFDSSALTAIYRQFSPGLYRYALRLLGDDCLAEDCVAETFSRLLKALRAGRGPDDHLQAYLYRIAHNWITDCYRRQPTPTVDLDETLKTADRQLPEAMADFSLAQAQVRLAMRSLTPDQRQVITLRFLEGWENEEIAAALQKPAGAIRALQFRALASLRKALLPEEKEGVCEPEP